jgi:hypothetical protein
MYTVTLNIFQFTSTAVSFIEFPKFVPEVTINGLTPAAIFYTPGNSTA